MTGSALIDKDLVPLCRELEAGRAVFTSELRAVRPEHFVPWHDSEAYAGGWLVFPLVMQIDPVPPMYDLERNRRLCPRSYELLARHDRILVGGVSRLLPGCRIHSHEDRPKAGVLRFHLGLRVSGRTGLSFDGVDVETREGESLLFDQSMRHAAHNSGDAPRDVLIVDFEVTPDEAAALRRARGGVHLGPTAGSH